MMPNQISLFTSLQTFNFLPGSKTNSPNSGAGKALHSALKAIALAAPASRPAYWVRKLPDKDSILVITTWSDEDKGVEFFASETWASVLNELRKYLRSHSPAGGCSSIRFPQSHGLVGTMKPMDAREHEILTLKFPINAPAESIAEFNSRAGYLVDSLFNNLQGNIDLGKAYLKDFSGGWVSQSSEDGESTFMTYVAFMSWEDEREKERFKVEDRSWCHFWRKVDGLLEGVETTERFGGMLKMVQTFGSRPKFGFDSETEEDE